MDTIAAISTPPGEGGIGIIRISGPHAEHIAAKVFRPAKPPLNRPLSYRLYHGEVIDPSSGDRIDECLMAVMRQPHSYTGEDVVELQCHGSPLVLLKVLRAAIEQGARAAEAGEFTKRAFLNGKIDLSQAEAVIDIITAKTGISLAIANNHLKGAFSERINSIRKRFIELFETIEASLDFPEEEETSKSVTSIVEETLSIVSTELNTLIATFEEGKILQEGMSVIILGQPNVGKSTLLNCLLREERAIVTTSPGTTRDIIEDTVAIRGLPVKLADTAGLRSAADEAEEIGIRLAMKKLESAHLIIYVTDPGGCFPKDLDFLDKAEKRKTIVAINKSDLYQKDEIQKTLICFSRWDTIALSAKYGTGIEKLKDMIFFKATGRAFSDNDTGREEIITNLRHKTAIEGAMEAADRAKSALLKGVSGEFVSFELREGADRLGEVTGKITNEEILYGIFERFCIGK